MRRMRTAGLVIFTLFTLLMLAFTADAVMQGVHDERRSSLADTVYGLVFVVTMTVAAAGLWLRELVRKTRRSQQDALAKRYAPRSKYAVWANRSHEQAGNPTRRGAVRTPKTLRRKR